MRRYNDINVFLEAELKDPGPARDLAVRWAREGDSVVVFRNQQFDSSEYGRSSVMRVGPERTYKSVAEVEGKWLNDLPSQRQYPTACYEPPSRCAHAWRRTETGDWECTACKAWAVGSVHKPGERPRSDREEQQS